MSLCIVWKSLQLSNTLAYYALVWWSNGAQHNNRNMTLSILTFCDYDIVSHGNGEAPKLMSRWKENGALMWQAALRRHSLVQGHENSHFS
jgi:hypothetical protein